MNPKIMIGLETHVQLNTKSKLFCSCSTSPAEPNQNTCEICLGFPGSKPTLNEEAVRKAVALALLMKCKLNMNSHFARKIYFYPDLPKGFQITQYDEPLSSKGQFSIETSGNPKTINITRVHMEEDPGKLEYVGGHIGTAKSVLADYNRSGMPLCEVVTEPDFETIDEAISYVRKLFHLLSYLDIIDPSQEGVMRTDANISIDGGARVELKNISGSDAVEQALKAELSRQIFLKAQGKKTERETRTYSEETGTTILLRKKEFEEDYGYIREPDLLPLSLDMAFIEKVKSEMKKLPGEVQKEIAKKHKLPSQIAYQLAYKRGMYNYFESCLSSYKDAGKLSRWLVGDFLKCANWHNFEIESCPLPEKFLELLNATDSGKITEREAKELIKKMFDEPDKQLKDLMGTEGPDADIDELIKQVMDDKKEIVKKIETGDKNAVNFLVGEVLKASRYKADPKKVKACLDKIFKV